MCLNRDLRDLEQEIIHERRENAYLNHVVTERVREVNLLKPQLKYTPLLDRGKQSKSERDAFAAEQRIRVLEEDRQRQMQQLVAGKHRTERAERAMMQKRHRLKKYDIAGARNIKNRHLFFYTA